MIRFEDPGYLLLLALPLLWWWLKRPASIGFSSTGLLSTVQGKGRARLAFILPAATGLGLVLLVIALARPQWEEREVFGFTEGIDMVLLLDVSSSMTERSHLEEAKKVVRAFAQARTSDRVGLITFARYPKLVCPLTTDSEALARMIDPLAPMALGSELDGTGIGAALAEAARVLERSEGDRVAILLTDGEENQFVIEPDIAARLCAELKIKVYTVAASEEIDTSLHERIAALTGGRFRTAVGEARLDAVFREIDALEKRPVEDRPVVRRAELFRWLLLPAALLMLLEFLLSRTFLKRIP
jgi:Ca-activated chloride channel family protein